MHCFKTAAPSINIAPPSNIEVEIGGHFTIICEAVGTPTPIIAYLFKWRHIPTGYRVHVSSVNGRGNLTITDARMSDSGGYTCEAKNVKGSILASPHTSVLVKRKYSIYFYYNCCMENPIRSQVFFFCFFYVEVQPFHSS